MSTHPKVVFEGVSKDFEKNGAALHVLEDIHLEPKQ